ncbi:MAG TPA: hypothetical protein VNT42_11000 [Sphingomonas sp.]|nr:hypothetical protein [Sphingomonas sp.]
MRTTSKLLLGAVGVLAAAGTALAAADRSHVMTVAMPDGSVAHIRYVGDVAPRVAVAPAVRAMPVAMLDADPFAMMERISLAMDRQMDAMLQQAALLAKATPATDGALSTAALSGLPAGTMSYSVTSYSSSDGASCSQSVQVTSLGQNQPPRVVKQSQGDCTAMNSRAPIPAVQQAKPAAPTLTPASLEKAKEPAPKGPVI